MNVVRFDPFTSFFRDFDRIAGRATSALVENFTPPHDIVQVSEHDYVVSLAVPGYREDELEVTLDGRELRITGKPREGEAVEGDENGSGKRWLRRGIAKGSFEARFSLGEHIEIGEARLENGILEVSLVRRIPDALKPRSIAIKSGNGSRKAVEAAAA